MTPYHIEAAIAGVHAAASSAGETDWGAIVRSTTRCWRCGRRRWSRCTGQSPWASIRAPGAGWRRSPPSTAASDWSDILSTPRRWARWSWLAVRLRGRGSASRRAVPGAQPHGASFPGEAAGRLRRRRILTDETIAGGRHVSAFMSPRAPREPTLLFAPNAAWGGARARVRPAIPWIASPVDPRRRPPIPSMTTATVRWMTTPCPAGQTCQTNRRRQRRVRWNHGRFDRLLFGARWCLGDRRPPRDQRGRFILRDGGRQRRDRQMVVGER